MSLSKPSAAFVLPVYQPSGRIGVRAVVAGCLVGLPVALLLGYALAWAQARAPGLIASIICTALSALVCFLAFSAVCTLMRVRNKGFATLVGVLLLACLLSVRWLVTLAAHGGALDALVHDTSTTGWLTFGAGALAEAGFIALLGVFAFRAQVGTPFSEQAGQWASKGFEGELWCMDDQAQVQAGLQEQGVAYLLDLTRAAGLGVTPASTRWQTLKVTGTHVASDLDARWLSLSQVLHERGEDGKVKTQSVTWVEHWHVSDADFQALNAHLSSDEAAAGVEAAAQAPAGDGPEDRPTPKELEAALAALNAQQFAVAVSLAKAHWQHPDPLVRADAARMCALAHARLGQWAASFEAYHHLYELEPSVLNALQLATTSVMVGELLRGQAWYERACALNASSQDMPPARLCTAYLSALEQAGEFESAQPHLDWLAQGYRAMRITDDHFVWTRGFPFFAEFLRKSQALLLMCMAEQDVRRWYEAMRGDLDEAGQLAIDQHLAGLQQA